MAGLPIELRLMTDRGGMWAKVPPATSVDGVFIIADISGDKWELHESNREPYYARYAGAYGAGDKTSLFQAAINNAAISKIVLDKPVTISGTLTIPAGKVVQIVGDGKFNGSGTVAGMVTADYDKAIFAQTLTTTNIRSATDKVSLEWWSPTGDGTTSDQTAITKAFSCLTKWVILGKSNGSSSVYNVANTGNFNSMAVGSVAEFLPGAKLKPGVGATGNLSFGCRIIAGETQHIVEVSEITARLSLPEASGNSLVSVYWTGAVGDGTTDSTIPMQVAANWACNATAGSANTRVNLYLPPGKFRCDNLQMRHNLIGNGEMTTIQAFTDGQFAIIASQNISSFDSGSWVYSRMQDFTVQGNNVSSGIKFGNLGVDDQDVGKWLFERININKCIYGIQKPAGNIGNEFRNLSFTFGDFQYHATENVSPVMHAGCDYFYNCHFKSAQKAAVYIKQSANGGNHNFLNCILEYNPGFAFFVAEYGNALFPLNISNCYIEGNGTAGTVNIDGVDEEADVNMLFNSAKCVYIDHTSTVSMRVRNASVVHVSNSNMYNGDAEVQADTSSVVVYDKMFGFNIDNTDVYCLTPPISDPDSSGRVKFNQGYPRAVRFPTNNFLISRTCQSLQPTGGGFPSGASGITIANDGVLFPKCWEIQSGAVSQIQVLDAVSVTGSKFVVCQAALKKISGTGVARIQFVNSAGADFQWSGTNWKYFTQILATGAGSSAYALAWVGDVVYRIACVQMHLFDTFQEAYEFSHANQFTTNELQSGLDVGLRGGRTFIGGNDSGDNAVIRSTSYPTKGEIVLGDPALRALRVHEDNNWNVTIGQNLPNQGVYATAYSVLTISDNSNGGTVAHPIIELACTQRDSTSGGDPTKVLGKLIYRNNATSVSAVNQLVGEVLVRADGATNTNRGGRFEIWLKTNNATGVIQYFAVDNTGKVYILTTPTTSVSGQFPLYRNGSTGEVTQGPTVAAVDSIDKFTITGTSSRTVATGQTIYEIHLKSNASITVNIGTSAGGTDIGTHSLVSGVTVIQPFIQTADSTVTVHFTYTSGSGNIDVIHVKKIY